MPTSLTLKGIWLAIVAIAFAVLLILLAVQTVRLEGFKIWPLSYEGALPKIKRYETAFAEIERKTVETTAKWKQAIEAKEQDYRNKAQEADDNAEEALSGAMAAAERHIANNRVQCPANRGGVNGPAASASGGSAGGGDGPGRDAELVAVTPDDIRICTTNSVRLQAVRDWALSLGGS